MPVFLVTYDLNKETVRPKIVEEVHNSDSWAKLSESSYAISTTETTTDVHNRFKPYLDDDDNIYIITLKRPYTGFGPKAVNDWLEKHLTY